jgi:hypothetical protein
MVDPARVAHVDPVYVDVHEPPELAALVEDEIGDREGLERGGDGIRLDLEPPLPAHLGGKHSRKQHYCQSAVSTERIGGSCEAASVQLSPPSLVTNTEPLCVPK